MESERQISPGKGTRVGMDGWGTQIGTGGSCGEGREEEEDWEKTCEGPLEAVYTHMKIISLI